MSYQNPLHTRSGNVSGYSSLGGAVAGSAGNRYRLNQPIYTPTNKYQAHTGRHRYDDVNFDWVGGAGQGCSMLDLKARSLSGLLETMRGGADKPYAHNLELTKLNFHIMWPGYTASIPWTRSIDITHGGPITRARLAQLISEQFIHFFERALHVPSTQVKDHIGSNGIQLEYLRLVSLQNTTENNFQATIVIEIK